MGKNKFLSNNFNSLNDNDDFEIDLTTVASKINKHKKFISVITIVSAFVSSIVSLNLEKKWLGQFQIVLDNNNNDNGFSRNISPDSNGFLDSLNIRAANQVNISTQVEILKSPSVLLPVYNFVNINNLDNKKKQRYSDWFNKKLKIELEKGTSILNISYIDNDKQSIIPILTKISNSYQRYSLDKRKNQLIKGINYLENQINLYKNKTLSMLNEIQTFEIENDMTWLKEKDIKGENKTIVDELRIKSNNEIKKIDGQLNQLNKVNKNEDKIMYISLIRNENQVDNQKFIKELQSIDSELINKRFIYKENSIEIKKLENLKDSIINKNFNDINSLLKAKRQLSEALKISSTRPKNIILQYKELIRESNRNNETLSQLEKQLRTLNLENSKRGDPWELITKPTLFEDPVAPRKKLIVFISSLITLIVGALLVLIFENFKGLITSKNEFDKIIKSQFFEEIDADSDLDIEEKSKLIKPILKDIDSNNKISLLMIGNIKQTFVEKLRKNLNSIFKEHEVKIYNDILDIQNQESLIVFANIENQKKADFIKYKNRIDYLSLKIIGWFMVL